MDGQHDGVCVCVCVFGEHVQGVELIESFMNEMAVHKVIPASAMYTIEQIPPLMLAQRPLVTDLADATLNLAKT